MGKKCKECERKDDIIDARREQMSIDRARLHKVIAQLTRDLRLAEEQLRAKSKELDHLNESRYQLTLVLKQVQQLMQESGWVA
jgi:IMP dehydrogenase/GMP reductase